MKNKRGKGHGLWTLVIVIILAFLIWGIIGGVQAQDVGVTCDMGIGEKLCWKWHKNFVGQTQEFLNDVLK